MSSAFDEEIKIINEWEKKNPRVHKIEEFADALEKILKDKNKREKVIFT